MASISSIPSGALQDSGFKIRAGFRIEDSRFGFGIREFKDQGVRIRLSGSRIQDSGFGIRDSGFRDVGIRRFENSGFGIRRSGFRGIEYQFPGFAMRDLGFAIRDAEFEFQGSGFGSRI